MNLSSQQAFSSKASKLLSWGHWFTFANILFALVVSSLYLFADPLPSTFSGKLFLLFNWIGHIGFLTFLCFVLTIFPLSLIFPYPRHIRGMAAVIATFAMSLLALDAFVYFQLGYHLSPQVFEQIVGLISDKISGNPSLSLFVGGTAIFAILFFELVASNYTWRHLTELRQFKYKKLITPLFIMAFVSSHLIHIWADANVKLDITKQDNVLPLSYPTTAKSLLARYQMLDLDAYKEAQSVTFSNQTVNYTAPNQALACNPVDNTFTVLVFDKQKHLDSYVGQHTLYKRNNFYLPKSKQESLFNLVYGIPSYYQQSIRTKGNLPVWTNSIDASFVNLNRLAQSDNAMVNFIYIKTDDELASYANASANFAFSIESDESSAWFKSTLYTSDNRLTTDGIITPQDIIKTILDNGFSCKDTRTMLTGNNLLTDFESGVNLSANTLMIYKRDKLTLLTSDGEYKTVSAKQGFLIDSDLDIPFFVEHLKKLKQFEQ